MATSPFQGQSPTASEIGSSINTLPARDSTISVAISTVVAGGFAGSYTPPADAQTVIVELQGGGSWRVGTATSVANATTGMTYSSGEKLLLASNSQYTFFCTQAGGVVYGGAA